MSSSFNEVCNCDGKFSSKRASYGCGCLCGVSTKTICETSPHALFGTSDAVSALSPFTTLAVRSVSPRLNTACDSTVVIISPTSNSHCETSISAPSTSSSTICDVSPRRYDFVTIRNSARANSCKSSDNTLRTDTTIIENMRNLQEFSDDYTTLESESEGETTKKMMKQLPSASKVRPSQVSTKVSQISERLRSSDYSSEDEDYRSSEESIDCTLENSEVFIESCDGSTTPSDYSTGTSDDSTDDSDDSSDDSDDSTELVDSAIMSKATYSDNIATREICSEAANKQLTISQIEDRVSVVAEKDNEISKGKNEISKTFTLANEYEEEMEPLMYVPEHGREISKICLTKTAEKNKSKNKPPVKKVYRKTAGEIKLNEQRNGKNSGVQISNKAGVNELTTKTVVKTLDKKKFPTKIVSKGKCSEKTTIIGNYEQKTVDGKTSRKAKLSITKSTKQNSGRTSVKKIDKVIPGGKISNKKKDNKMQDNCQSNPEAVSFESSHKITARKIVSGGKSARETKLRNSASKEKCDKKVVSKNSKCDVKTKEIKKPLKKTTSKNISADQKKLAVNSAKKNVDKCETSMANKNNSNKKSIYEAKNIKDAQNKKTSDKISSNRKSLENSANTQKSQMSGERSKGPKSSASKTDSKNTITTVKTVKTVITETTKCVKNSKTGKK